MPHDESTQINHLVRSDIVQNLGYAFQIVTLKTIDAKLECCMRLGIMSQKELAKLTLLTSDISFDERGSCSAYLIIHNSNKIVPCHLEGVS